MWASLYTPVGKLKYEKLNYRMTKLSTLLEELLSQDFSGYVEILAPHEHGLIIFCEGTAYSSFYEGTEELNLSQKEIIEHFLRSETTERETIINVGELDPGIVAALSALMSSTPAHRELETVFLDMSKLFETFARKTFTGTLRFYRIRNNTRLGNILLRLEKITAEQLRDAIRLQLSGEGALRLGDALKQIGAIDEKGIEEALDRQTVTRKGSDIELALAVFHQGEFLGGYRHSDKALIKDKLEVIKWLAVSEILMDIIDGALPDPLDVKAILHPENPALAKPKPAPAPKAIVPEAPKTETVAAEKAKPRNAADDIVFRELTDETFMLKADDLILDIHPQPLSRGREEDEEAADQNLSWLDDLINQDQSEQKKAEGGNPRDLKPAIPEGLAKAAESIITTKVEPTVPTPPAAKVEEVKPVGPARPAVSDDKKEAEKPEAPQPAPETPAAEKNQEGEAQEEVAEEIPHPRKPADPGLDAVQLVVVTHMGFLGKALIDRETKHMELDGDKRLSPSQLKNLNQRLYHATSLVVGEKTAERIMIEVENEIGGD